MSTSLLLTEKYRPRTLAAIKGKGNQPTVAMLDSWVKKRNFPNSYLYGPPGCGKTSAARIVASTTYGEDASDWMYREYEAVMLSKEEVCTTIKRWVTSWVGVQHWEGYGTPGFRINLPFPSYRLIILDECERMTPIVETLLRKLLEDYQAYVRFILLYNDISKMSAPIQSRLTGVEFFPLTSIEIRNAISNVIQNEGASSIVTQQQINQITNGCHGDLRTALNWLEKYI
jgi:DNA polymerase III delta prime subunit